MSIKNEPTPQIISIPTFADARGALSVVDLSNVNNCWLPFDVGRVFWITNIPKDSVRGAHAHQYCWEALVAVNGKFSVKVNDGHGFSTTFTLQTPSEALVIPPMVWCELSNFSTGAVCLCLASGSYAPEGYLNSREDFAQCIANEK